MAPGHFIPMIDMAKLLAQHGVTVTVVTTPLIASRFNPIINRAIESGLPLRLLSLRFPSVEAGLPEGFEELEPRYMDEYRKVKGDKVWCIGPLSLCNKDNLDKAQRGDKAAIDENLCLKWLDEQEPGSVVYACLGSTGRLSPLQLIELGLSLEASKRPFVWVIRGGAKAGEIEKWVEEDGFEERVKGNGLVIRGWAPQVLILSHPAVGAFLTHCGWNSTLEGILETGVSVGAQAIGHMFGEDKCTMLVKREVVREAVEEVMGEGIEGEERRRRARLLGEMAKKAMEEGGSSYLNFNEKVFGPYATVELVHMH
ncbi:hypothetical protein HYC85_015937 [Camellia sinensis]|uniref:UDP-glycosyltransferases domain-containing protein n=1 Tax=Camellia sinensis TaxID=4442 RepID=A0A7J7GYB5_CAMSI|nr:hypothetical protein HYC85_015937 [Camellia sinensis]